MPRSPCVTIHQPNPLAAVRLLCIPDAGGSAAVFRQWPKYIHPRIEVCAIELPGRATRLMEPPFTSMPVLIEALAGALNPFLDKSWPPSNKLGDASGRSRRIAECGMRISDCGMKARSSVNSGVGPHTY